MKLGVFGGTFDPPHLGHLILAAEARHQLSLDRLLFVLTPTPPHKGDHPITPLDHRLDMLLAAIGEDPDFEISRVDIERPAPHFAADTVEILGRDHPEAELTYLMGGDSLEDLPTWHDPRRFVAGCQALGVMRRPGERANLSVLESQIPGISRKVRYIRAPLLEISSSEIRQRIAQERPFRYYLPPPVYQVIQERRLYRKL